MTHQAAIEGLRLGEDAWLGLDELARACGVATAWIEILVEEGLVRPQRSEPAWCFGGEELARVRRIKRLQRDFDASLSSVAVMLDLLDEIERLRAVLQRAGLQT